MTDTPRVVEMPEAVRVIDDWLQQTDLSTMSTNRAAYGLVTALESADLTVEQGWRSWSEVPQGVLEVDAYRPDAGVFVAVFRFLSNDVESWWASESGEDLTDDLPTHFRLRPTPPQEEGK